jgi:salicylate hydroxylase
VSWLGKDKHFLVFPVSQNKTLNVVAFITKPEDQLGNLKESWTSSAPREELEKEYEGWDETLIKTIRCMDPYPGKWRLNDRELLSQWIFMDGKTVLMGDAAHAMLPHQGTYPSPLTPFPPPSEAYTSSGSGAGHSIEDGYILGRALKDYFAELNDPKSGLARPLSVWTHVYQKVRLPRTQKAQITSRQAGDVYEMQGPDFQGLSYDECLPIVEEKLKHRMKWVWGGDIDAEYERVVRESNLRN